MRYFSLSYYFESFRNIFILVYCYNYAILYCSTLYYIIYVLRYIYHNTYTILNIICVNYTDICTIFYATLLYDTILNIIYTILTLYSILYPLLGFSNISALPHTGVLYQCELIQKVPHSIRRNLLKIIANKVALLARIDSYASIPTTTTSTTTTITSSSSNNTNNKINRGLQNAQGVKFREEIENKIEKLLEPHKARTHKALPIPEEKKRSKRGE